MSQRTNHVDQIPDIDSAKDFSRWPGEPRSSRQFDPPGHRSPDGDLSASSHQGYPFADVDDSRSRLLDWLFLPRVRRNAVAITTFAVLGVGVWLLADALSGSTATIDLPDAQADDLSELGATSDDTINSVAVDPNSDIDSRVPVGPVRSADGRIALTAAAADDGWTVELDAVDPLQTQSEGVSIVALVDGAVVAESADLPFRFDVKPDAESDTAALVVSAFVDWEDGHPRSPVVLALDAG